MLVIEFHFFHAAVQISQNHLLKRLFLLHLCFYFICQVLIDHRDLSLFWGSLFCSIGLCVCFYATTRLFWLQWPCNTVWYQVLWSLLLCSSFSKLLEVFGVIYCSIEISEMFVLYLWNVIGALIGIVLNLLLALGSMAILMMLILPIHEHGTCFHLFVSSLISFFSVV